MGLSSKVRGSPWSITGGKEVGTSLGVCVVLSVDAYLTGWPRLAVHVATSTWVIMPHNTGGAR